MALDTLGDGLQCRGRWSDHVIQLAIRSCLLVVAMEGLPEEIASGGCFRLRFTQASSTRDGRANARDSDRGPDGVTADLDELANGSVEVVAADQREVDPFNGHMERVAGLLYRPQRS